MIRKKLKINPGATLAELLVTIAIIIIITVISVPIFLLFQKKSELNNSTEEIINVLRIAQNKALASEQASQYGVFFDTNVSPHQYTLFKGLDFASRDENFDKVYKLPNTIEIYDIDLAGGNEVVFDRLTGTTSQPGDLSLRLKTDPGKTKIIYIEGIGQVGLTAPLIPSNSRTEDSRHVHFDYIRLINTAAETLTLDFNTVTRDILISENLRDGQIYWEGEVEVDSEVQKIKIHTHRLNSPDTQFCIHRDGRYNNKALTITISGDSSGNLIDYSADGLFTSSASVYVTDINWQ